ncbi:hypothetical protein ACTI_70610 [Actinoplanes sp. OR16]|nr:hypothetical protein ACTI_70610 [Actinoplanes sp. OR16]
MDYTSPGPLTALPAGSHPDGLAGRRHYPRYPEYSASRATSASGVLGIEGYLGMRCRDRIASPGEPVALDGPADLAAPRALLD